MANITQVELNAIREVVGSHALISAKLGDYAKQCKDPQIKQMFKAGSEEAAMSADKLLKFL